MKLLKRIALSGGILGFLFSAILITFTSKESVANTESQESYRIYDPCSDCFGSGGNCLPTVIIISPKPPTD